MTQTFERRSGNAAPQSLPLPPGDWELPFRRLSDEINLMADLTKGHELAARLLDAILSGSVTSGR